MTNPSELERNRSQLARVALLAAQHEQCRKAFLRDPSPRLGAALKMIEAAIRAERKSPRAQREI